MYCGIIITKEKKLNTICGFCFNIEDNDRDLQYKNLETYTEIPMIWCNCCENEYFLDLRNEDLENFSENKNLEKYKSDISTFSQNIKFQNNLEKVNFYKIPILKIEKIATQEIKNYDCEKKLCFEEIGEILDNDFSKEVIQKYNLIKCDSKMINLYIPCDNYFMTINEDKLNLENIDLYTGCNFNYCLLEDGIN